MVGQLPGDVSLAEFGPVAENDDGPTSLLGDNSGKNKRQAEFHQIFKSIPGEELLIECLAYSSVVTKIVAYACALNRDILIQGRMYLGERHVCFYANILGWITSVVISLKDVVSIEKRSTALVFPNAIQISTLHHRYFFASFMFREDAHNRLIATWSSVLIEKVLFVR